MVHNRVYILTGSPVLPADTWLDRVALLLILHIGELSLVLPRAAARASDGVRTRACKWGSFLRSYRLNRDAKNMALVTFIKTTWQLDEASGHLDSLHEQYGGILMVYYVFLQLYWRWLKRLFPVKLQQWLNFHFWVNYPFNNTFPAFTGIML